MHCYMEYSKISVFKALSAGYNIIHDGGQHIFRFDKSHNLMEDMAINILHIVW